MTTTHKNHLNLVDETGMEVPPTGTFTLGYLNGELIQMDSAGDGEKILTDASIGDEVLGTKLADLSIADSSPLTEDDTVLEGVGKLQAQVDNKLDSVKNYTGDRKSEFFHESDGGGYRFTNSDAGTISFIGLNDSSTIDIKGEIYAIDSSTHEGSRIIQTLSKTYYTSRKTDSSFTSNDEIATKADLVSTTNTTNYWPTDTLCFRSSYAKLTYMAGDSGCWSAGASRASPASTGRGILRALLQSSKRPIMPSPG
jgi:hypothetical protein